MSDAPAIATLIGELAALMRRETELLRSGRVREIDALLPRKDSLSRELARRVPRFAEEAAAAALKAEVAALLEAAGENVRALTAATAANERLFREIARAAAERKALPLYGPAGRQAGSELSLALGRSF